MDIDSSAYRAVIFDMEGVAALSAPLDAQAWRQIAILAGHARLAGLGSAVVASGKKGPPVTDRSGLAPLFDALVDANVAADPAMRDRPEPDTIVEAARRLKVDPGQAVLFEDDLAGVQAGRAAGVKLVVGVARNRDERRLLEGVADVVVDDLSGVRFLAPGPRSTKELGSAHAALDVVEAMITALPRTAVFLDYDGTLTPIVSRPELAKLGEATRDTLSRLAARYTVAVISGRGLDDVRSLVGLDGLLYAGSHGLEIIGPGTTHSPLEKGKDYVPVIDQVERSLHEQLDDLAGVLIERKRLSVAVHFRLASREAEPIVAEAVQTVMSRNTGLRRSGGKKVVEIRPDIDWDKGKAVEWLLEQMGEDPRDTLAIYVGDDLTDEDAFRALRGRGVGIVVRDPAPRETYADLALDDPEDVRGFLESLVEMAGRVASVKGRL